MAEPEAEPIVDHKFKVGDKVQYMSITKREWLPAIVLKLKGFHQYDLDIKVDAEEYKMRYPPHDNHEHAQEDAVQAEEKEEHAQEDAVQAQERELDVPVEEGAVNNHVD